MSEPLEASPVAAHLSFEVDHLGNLDVARLRCCNLLAAGTGAAMR
jgi:hypothetical protein